MVVLCGAGEAVPNAPGKGMDFAAILNSENSWGTFISILSADDDLPTSTPLFTLAYRQTDRQTKANRREV